MISKPKMKKLIIVLILMIIVTLSCVFYRFLNPFFINLLSDRFNIVSSENNMLIHFIDVDQADAAAINLPDGKIMLIDTGSEEVNTSYVKYIKENVLHTKRNHYIDYLVLSHADMDHVGGTLKLLKTFEIGLIYLPKIASASQGYQEILSFVENNCEYQILGEEFCLQQNNYEITFFQILNNSNTNDSSQIVKVSGFGKSFLFTGDISSGVEQDYINEYGFDLDCDVLKVSHHGSSYSSSQEFLEIVTPEYAVISVGKGNDYGHPTYDLLQRLNASGAQTIRTDKNGNIMFVLGVDYALKQLSGNYYIFSLSLNYVWYVLFIDGVLLISCVVIIVKKDKNKHLSN